MDCIAAIATPLVPSAIGIVRVTGPGCLSLADSLFFPKSGRPLSSSPGHRLLYGRLQTRQGRPLDQCLAAVFRGPASYTGEDSVEFQCHGSPMVLTDLLSELLALGVRQAEPGEFTRRAFLNGRLDLVQAEAVADLIEAETSAAARNAAGQLEGTLSKPLEQLYQTLLETEAHFQALVDYPDEEIEPFHLEQLAGQLSAASDRLHGLADTFSRGRRLKEGISCALVGRPNVGKSSILNALTGQDRAIVTPLPGTTRDTISETAVLGGLAVRLTDTAGIRQTQEPVERLGVERSYQAAQTAQLILCVLDGSTPLEQADRALIQQLPQPPLVLLVNKSDLPARLERDALARLTDAPVLSVSARTGDGFQALEQLIAQRFLPSDSYQDGMLLTSLRQAEAARQSLQALDRGRQALCSGLTPDAVLLDVEEALQALGEVLGRSLPEDLLQTLFSRFCVGK